MPNTQSAKRVLRKDQKRRLINKSTLHKIKSLRKKFLKNIADNDITSAQTSFIETQSVIAKAAKKNILHWKTAARYTSRMSKKFPKVA